VVYLERGRVVAHGTHEQLLAAVTGYGELVTAYERAEQERHDAYQEIIRQRGGLDDELEEIGPMTDDAIFSAEEAA
jgi:ATP-binding cassette, subfamily B, bacterial